MLVEVVVVGRPVVQEVVVVVEVQVQEQVQEQEREEPVDSYLLG